MGSPQPNSISLSMHFKEFVEEGRKQSTVPLYKINQRVVTMCLWKVSMQLTKFTQGLSRTQD